MSDQQELTPLQQQARANIEAHKQSQTFEAKRAAQAEQQITAFKQQAQRVYVGSAVEFETAWPRILEDWKAKQTIEKAVAATRQRSTKL